MGSYGKFALFKAEVLNDFVNEYDVKTAIEFGCGDGNQVSLLEVAEYIGVDVSSDAITACKQRYRNDNGKRFLLIDDYRGESGELSVSLDVIYHLVEDEVFDSYMRTLFDASSRYVVIYSSNSDIQEDGVPVHIRHRRFTRWIHSQRPHWRLIKHVPNRFPYEGDYREGSWSEFFFFAK